MARSRRGSFGLQPRVAPNVTGQIVALAREYVAKRDSNIMDAWRNGGTFEGKKVTDDMVLKYWKEREQGLDEGDPNYEAAKNQVMQLEYAVAQSKMDLKHVQGKISDTEYAHFFMGWAKKVPVNSEFYRTLQKDAAGLIERAKATARANGERARTEAFNAFATNVQDRDIAIGDAMTKALTGLSQSTGLSIKGNGDELLALLTQNVSEQPDQYKYLLDTIHKADPGWNGQLTEGYFSEHIKQATQGYELIADRAHKQGFVSAYASATQGMADMSQWGQNLKVWPVAQSYTHSENAFLKVWNDPNASQMDKMMAASHFSQQLTTMASTPGIDVASKTMIEADAQRLLGQDAGDNPSFGTSQLGRPGISPEMTMALGAWQQTKMEMDANPTAWAYAPVDQNGQFDPTGRGPLGMVPAGAVQPGAQAVMVPGADGKAVMAMVMPHSVYSTDPNNPSASPQLAGYQITYNVGGRQVEMWGYKDNSGANHWSLTSPLAEGTTTTVNNKGDVFVTPSRTTQPLGSQIANLRNPDGSPHTLTPEEQTALLNGGSVTTKTSDVAKGKAGTSTSLVLSVKDGYLQSSMVNSQIDATGKVVSSTTTPTQLYAVSPQQNAFSQSRMSAGDIPGITFSSAMMASVKAASYTQTQDQVSKFAADPAFQQAFLSQTMQTLGTNNPFDARIATAWKDVTTANKPEVPAGIRSNESAAKRFDLTYPGQTPAAQQGSLSVTFGGQQGSLKLPGLPSYLNQATANLTPLGDAAKVAQGIFGNILPGLGAPPQQPQGSPAPAVTPIPAPTTVTPMPTAMPPSLAPITTSTPPPGYTDPNSGKNRVKAV